MFDSRFELPDRFSVNSKNEFAGSPREQALAELRKRYPGVNLEEYANRTGPGFNPSVAEDFTQTVGHFQDQASKAANPFWHPDPRETFVRNQRGGMGSAYSMLALKEALANEGGMKFQSNLPGVNAAYDEPTGVRFNLDAGQMAPGLLKKESERKAGSAALRDAVRRKLVPGYVDPFYKGPEGWDPNA